MLWPLLLGLLVRTAAAQCAPDMDNGDRIVCRCQDAAPIGVTFSAFDDSVAEVVIRDCLQVNFQAGQRYENPASVIVFDNITNLLQVPNQLAGPTSAADLTGVIRELRFTNIRSIPKLDMDQLFPLTKVELFLLDNINEIKEITGRSSKQSSSRVTELHINKTFIKELHPGAFRLRENRLFSMTDSYVFHWRSKGLEVDRTHRLSVLDSKVSSLYSQAFAGVVDGEVEISRTYFGDVAANGFAAAAHAQNVRMEHNRFRQVQLDTFKGLFAFGKGRNVSFSNNLLPCPSPNPPVCLGAVGRMENNDCFLDDTRSVQNSYRFVDMYHTHCAALYVTPSVLLFIILIIIQLII